MKITAIKTRPILPPQDNIMPVILENVKQLPEKSVLVISSKIVAIHQGRTVPADQYEKDDLAKQEADVYVDRDIVPGEHILFTIKDNILIASAGIDASNAKDHLILWPNDSYAFAKEVHSKLKQHFGTREFGIVISDSHVVFMRRGVQGISLASFGFNPISSYIGKPDIFGRPLKVSVSNIADSIAVAAVLDMGEGDECTPLALVEDIKQIEFSEDDKVNHGDPFTFSIPPEEDLFAPMIQAVPWQKGGEK